MIEDRLRCNWSGGGIAENRRHIVADCLWLGRFEYKTIWSSMLGIIHSV